VGNPLAFVIQEEIDRFGHISFARFMELALYHPELGYYRRGSTDVFGVQGDFYTAGQLQPVWGELLSDFVAQAHRTTPETGEYGVLDLGAGRQELRESLRQWRYRAFDWNTEPLPETFSGVVIANEFFDALPVHLLRKRNAGWCEVMVERRDDRFTFADRGKPSAPLLQYARCYGDNAADGQLMEVCLAAAEWMERIGALLRSGDVLIADYGYEAQELPRLAEGTILGFRRHTASADILSEPGTRDITAHVNFSYLRDLAIRAGLDVIGESSLATWAMNVWNEEALTKRWKNADDRWRMQWKHLVFGMGSAFRVLHLRKKNRAEKVATK
jgi:SAM-dependent MidA family methyltransferase